jgi:HD-GYP domain-containing protein (c-di-GMP phosphodiesterase class II)
MNRHGVEGLVALAAGSVEAVLVTRCGRVVFANQQFYQLLTLPAGQDIVGRVGFDFVSPEYQDAVAEKEADSEPTAFETVLVDGDGHPVPVYMSISVIAVEGTEYRIFGILDLRPLREMEERATRTSSRAVDAVFSAVEYRDPSTSGHMSRTSEIATRIATRLGMSPDQVSAIGLGARLHDVGKLAVPMEILLKPCALLAWEWEGLKQHAAVGYEILSGLDLPSPILPIVRHHHERLDGSGYPDRLTASEIADEVRVVAVADALDAITDARPYHRMHSCEEALAIMRGEAGHFWKEALDAAEALFRDGALSDVGCV